MMSWSRDQIWRFLDFVAKIRQLAHFRYFITDFKYKKRVPEVNTNATVLKTIVSAFECVPKNWSYPFGSWNSHVIKSSIFVKIFLKDNYFLQPECGER